MRHPDRVILLLEWAVLAAVVVAIGRPPQSDQAYYLDVARHLASGQGIADGQGHPTAFITPGFPIALAPFVSLWGLRAAVAWRVFQALLLALTAWMGQDILRLLGFSQRARTVAQVAIAAYVPFVLSAAEILTETLAGACVMALFWLLAHGLRVHATTSRRIPFGLLVATMAASFAAIAVRPTALLFTAALGAVTALAWPLRHESRRVIGALLLAAFVGDALFVAGWGMRNQRELGAFVPLSTEGSWVAFSGNDFAADGMGGLDTFRREVGQARADSVFALPEVQRSRYFSAALSHELASHAAQVPGLWLRKIARLWLNLGFPGPPSARSLVVAALNLVLLALLPRGIARVTSRAAGPGLAWCAGVVAFAAILTVAHVTTFAVVRYAFPALALLIVLGAAAVAEPGDGRAVRRA